MLFLVTVWLRDLDCEPLDEALDFLVPHSCSIRLRMEARRRFPDAAEIEIARIA